MELFTSIQILIEYYVSKQWRHCSAASDLGLQWLPMSHKKDARLIWVEQYPAFCKNPLFMTPYQCTGEILATPRGTAIVEPLNNLDKWIQLK